MNCHGITNLFLQKINFHLNLDLFTKILYYENLEPYGMLALCLILSETYYAQTWHIANITVCGLP